MVRKLFSVDGILYSFCVMIYKFVALNALYMVFCIPIVTAPASTGALFAVARRYARDEEPQIFITFWAGFRENWKQSTIVGTMFSVFGILFWTDVRLIVSSHGPFAGLMVIFLFTATLVAISTLVHVFPLMVFMRLNTRQLLSNSVRFGFVKPHLTVLCIAFLGGAVYLSFHLPVVLITAVFSFTATLIYWVIERKFQFILSLHDARNRIQHE